MNYHDLERCDDMWPSLAIKKHRHLLRSSQINHITAVPFSKEKICCIFISHTHLFFTACSFFSSAFIFSSLSFASALSPTTLEVGRQGWIPEFNYQTYQCRESGIAKDVFSFFGEGGDLGGSKKLIGMYVNFAIWRGRTVSALSIWYVWEVIRLRCSPLPRGTFSSPSLSSRAAFSFHPKKTALPPHPPFSSFPQ